MIDLWACGKIESPYRELIDYMNGVNNGGHFMHFDNVFNSANLKDYIEKLKLILPKVLSDNIDLAYKTYINNPDDMPEEDEKILSDCDRIYYDNENEINKLLKDRANKIDVNN